MVADQVRDWAKGKLKSKNPLTTKDTKEHKGHSGENSLRPHLRRKHPRGSSLAVAFAPAALGMTEGWELSSTRDRLQLGQHNSLLLLVLAGFVFVAGFAGLVALEEENLAETFVGIDLGWQGRCIRDF
jgi:hypothetical protein